MTLTRENINDYVIFLRSFLTGRTFEVYLGDIWHNDASLIEISLVTVEAGPMQINVVTDKAIVTIIAYDPNEFSEAVGSTASGLIDDGDRQTFWTEMYRYEQDVLVADHISFTIYQSHMR